MTLSEKNFHRTGVARWDVSEDQEPDAREMYRSNLADWHAVSGLKKGDSSSFFTRNTFCKFDGYVIGCGSSTGQILTRRREEIRRSSLDGFSIVLDLAGMTGDVDGRDIDTPAGNIHFRDLARPSTLQVKSLDVVVLTVPRETAPDWLLDGDFHGVSIDGGRAIGKLLAGHLASTAVAAPELSVDDGVVAIQAALVLAERATLNSGRLDSGKTQAIYRSLRSSAVRLIDRGLKNSAFSIEHLTTELGVSRTTLFRAFSPEGGINLYIRLRRLQKAREALLRRIGHRPTISEIAHAHGFVSDSHFSRAFREVYGHPPGSAQEPSASVRPAWTDQTGIRYDLVLDWVRGDRTVCPANSVSRN